MFILSLGEKKEQSGQFFWLPLTLHLKDTMGVMKFLWHHWVSEGQREIISRTLSDTGEVAMDIARRLACFLAGIHDFGKCTPAFQTQKGYQNSPDLDIALLNRLEQAELTGISSLNLDIAARKRSHHTVTGEYLLQYFGVQQDIASVIGAHHGKPVDKEEIVTKMKRYPRYCFQDETKGPCQRLWLAMQKKLLEGSLENFPISVFPARAGVIPNVHDTASFVISKIDTIIGSAIGIDIGFTQVIVYILQEVTYTYIRANCWYWPRRRHLIRV